MLAYWQVCVAHPIVSLNKHVVVYFVCLRGGAITLLLRGQSLQLCYSLGFFLSNFFPAQFAQLHFSQCSSSVFLFVCLFSFLIKWCTAGFLHFWCDDWRVTRLYTFYVMTCILPWCVYIHSPRQTFREQGLNSRLQGNTRNRRGPWRTTRRWAG